MRTIGTILALFFFLQSLDAQETKRVLFLGNSYTAYNNLPQMVADIAASMGDSLYFDSHTPGGTTLQAHSTNNTSQQKIAQGGWDYVVLQEQSQLPAFPYSQFATSSLPFALNLTQQIRVADSCTQPMFYMTWGRKNGDQGNCASYPPLCTYEGMQGKLRERYLMMADTTNSTVAPVGAAWRELRAKHPGIELYQADESHPNVNGSYLAACTFYASIFHKSPVGATGPATITAQNRAIIQQQAASTVFDSLHVWKIDTLTPHAQFIYQITNVQPTFLEVQLQLNTASNADSVYWDLGGGLTATGFSPIVQLPNSGLTSRQIKVEAWRRCMVDTDSMAFHIGSVSELLLIGIEIFPNPVSNNLQIHYKGSPMERGNLAVYNRTGKLLLQSAVDGSALDVSNLPKGLYLIEIELNGARIARRFTKN